MMQRALAMIIALAGGLSWASSASAAGYIMYVGTYSGPLSKGIYAWRFDPDTGKLTNLGLAATTLSPSFLAAHPNGRFLYAVNEISHFQKMWHSGSVSSFRIDPATGKLTLLNAVQSLGDGPCHLALDRKGQSLLVANYNNGSVSAFQVGANGMLAQSESFFQHRGSSLDPERQKGPHAHCILLSPDDRFALIADLGLDQVLSYRLDAAHAKITENDPPFTKVAPGSGPRHLAFHPNGKWVYLINEMKSTIITFAYDSANGSLRELQTVSTLPKDFSGHNDTAEIAVHPSGKFVYGSNRGHDSIAVFAVDPKAGTLKPVEFVSTKGQVPRNFVIDPSSKYLLAANQLSNNIVEFKIDLATGRLTPNGVEVKNPSPVCLTFVPAK